MLEQQELNNANTLKSEMTKAGITNEFAQTAISGVIYKESGFEPKSENLDYSKDSILRVFKSVPVELATKLAHNPQALGNYVYGPKYNPSLGNGEGEGFLFRGRGYNQITGKANYRAQGNKIGVDLVKNPDLMNDPKIAAKVAINFFKSGIESLKRSGKFTGKDINDFKDLKSAYNTIYNINAGVGKKLYDEKGNIIKDPTKGYKKGLDSLSWLSQNVIGLKDKIVETTQSATEVVKKNPLKTVMAAAGITLVIYIGFRLIKKNI